MPRHPAVLCGQVHTVICAVLSSIGSDTPRAGSLPATSTGKPVSTAPSSAASNAVFGGAGASAGFARGAGDYATPHPSSSSSSSSSSSTTGGASAMPAHAATATVSLSPVAMQPGPSGSGPSVSLHSAASATVPVSAASAAPPSPASGAGACDGPTASAAPGAGSHAAGPGPGSGDASPMIYTGVPVGFSLWLEMPCSRLVSLAQLPDSVLYCPFVYPALQVCNWNQRLPFRWRRLRGPSAPSTDALCGVPRVAGVRGVGQRSGNAQRTGPCGRRAAVDQRLARYRRARIRQVSLLARCLWVGLAEHRPPVPLREDGCDVQLCIA